MPYMQFLVSFQPGAAGGSGSRKGKQASQVGAEKEAAVEVGLATVSEEEWPEEEEDLEDGLPERQPPAATQKKRHRLMKLSDSRQQQGAGKGEKTPADAAGSSRVPNRPRKVPSKLRE